MRRALFAALALTVLMPLQALSATVTVKAGDTLSDIADRYGVSVGTLMRLNGLRDSNHVEIGQQLRIPGPTVTAGKGRHTVVSGDSLSTIASRYRVSQQALISLNNLGDADHVEVGQRLRLPSNAVLPQPQAATPKRTPVPVTAVPNATSHTVARGQTLTQIAKAYEVSVSSLVNINGIANPNAVEVGTKLLLRPTPTTSNAPLPTQSVPETGSTSEPIGSANATPSPSSSNAPLATQSVPETSATKQPATTETVVRETPTPQASEAKTSQPTLTATASTSPAASVTPQDADWRSYGPLKVDWGNWQTMAGSDVAPTLNGDGQPLYIAVNCDAQKINVTGANGAWKSWTAPQNGYEQDLVKDRCSK